MTQASQNTPQCLARGKAPHMCHLIILYFYS